MIRYIALCLILVAGFASCKKNTLPNTPKITLAFMTPDSIRQGSLEDTVYIQFELQDGDADLGNDINTQNYDIYLRDMRADTFVGYFFPEIQEDIKDPKKGLQGTCQFAIYGTLTYTRDDSLHMATGDTTQFELYIKDRAGNESNHINTGNLYIKLQ